MTQETPQKPVIEIEADVFEHLGPVHRAAAMILHERGRVKILGYDSTEAEAA
jgi:hypothetical protein